MAYIVAEPCVGCTFTDCVEVCPVDCFYVGPNFIVIHPDECIDCNACVPVCPVEAIYPEDELPEKWAHYAEWNAYLAPRWQALGHNLVDIKKVKFGDCDLGDNCLNPPPDVCYVHGQSSQCGGPNATEEVGWYDLN